MESKDYILYIQCLDRICNYYGNNIQLLPNGKPTMVEAEKFRHFQRADSLRTSLIKEMEEVIYNEVDKAKAKTKTTHKESKTKKNVQKNKKEDK